MASSNGQNDSGVAGHTNLRRRTALSHGWGLLLALVTLGVFVAGGGDEVAAVLETGASSTSSTSIKPSSTSSSTTTPVATTTPPIVFAPKIVVTVPCQSCEPSGCRVCDCYSTTENTSGSSTTATTKPTTTTTTIGSTSESTSTSACMRSGD